MTINTWLKGRFGDVGRTADGEDLRVDCPFCRMRRGRADGGKHLYVSIVKPAAHCFRCDWAGHWVGLILSVEGCTYADALKYIETPPADINRFERLTRIHSPRGLVQVDKYLSVPTGFKSLLKATPYDPMEHQAVWNYAMKRISPHRVRDRISIVENNMGYVPGTNRLWILIDDGWWQGRTILNEKPKYLSPPWPKGDALWNHKALGRFGHIVICEGVLSALHVGPHAIALTGKSMLRAQAVRIAKSSVSHITLMLDADADSDAHSMAQDLVDVGYNGSIMIHQLHKGDPCDGLVGDTFKFNFAEAVKSALQSV